MTRATRKATEPAPAVDPLADLREPDEPAGLPAVQTQEQPQEGPADAGLPEVPPDLQLAVLSAMTEATDAGNTSTVEHLAGSLLVVIAAHLDARPMLTTEQQDDAVAVVVAAWHADTTSHGFVHRGGQCGCHYLARLALGAALPAQDE